MSARIVVLDDHALLAQSLCVALAARGYDVRAPLPTTVAEVLAVVADEPADVVLLDLQLGGEIGSGTTLLEPLRRTGARVLVVSAVTEPAVVGAALEAGAAGYVCKSEPFEVLIDAAERVARGEDPMAPAARRALVAALHRDRCAAAEARRPFDRLSVREEEVLRALCDGRPVAQIAAEAFVSVATVRSQVRAVLVKLGVGSQLEAVALAFRHGWVDPVRESA